MILKVLLYIYSIFNLIFLNIFLFFKKNISKKKTIFFYHPKENLTKIHTYYIENFFKKLDNYNTVFASKTFISNHSYIKETLLKYILNTDIFVSNNLCNNFTHNSIRVYMHHDIYDTPLVAKKKEIEFSKRLLKYNNVFIASTKSIFLFNNIFKGLKKRPKIKVLGFYPKLNYLLEKKFKIKKNNNKIIIAPTNFNALPDFSLYPKLNKIISILIKQKYLVCLRPHPSNFEDTKVKLIKKKFEKYNNFYIDKSSNYSENYLTSDLMITDVSGTAYTYAFFTKNPVIFISNKERIINKSYYKKLSYFIDRKKIGYVVSDYDKLLFCLKKLKEMKTKKKFKDKILKIYKDSFSENNSDIFRNLR